MRFVCNCFLIHFSYHLHVVLTYHVLSSALAVLLAMSMRDLYTHMTEEDLSQLRKEDTSEDATNAEVVEMIQAKTEDGGSKLVPKYKKGTSVLYRSLKELLVSSSLMYI